MDSKRLPKAVALKIFVYFPMLFVMGIVLQAHLKEDRPYVKDFMSQQLLDLNSNPVDLSSWDHEVIVINFWGTWCPPCVREVPILKALQEQHDDKYLKVVGIGVDNIDKMRDFAKKNSINYLLLQGESSGIDMAFKLGNHANGLPFTVILGRDRAIEKTISGEITNAIFADVLHLLSNKI